jgi:uncharacterized membrane protein YfhO
VWQDPDDQDALGQARALEGAKARYLDARPGFVRVAVESPRDAQLILRRTSATGWSATVNGQPGVLRKANGRHQAVAIPAGASEVVLRYRASHARLGALVSLASVVVAVGLGRRARHDRETKAPAEA